MFGSQTSAVSTVTQLSEGSKETKYRHLRREHRDETHGQNTLSRSDELGSAKNITRPGRTDPYCERGWDAGRRDYACRDGEPIAAPRRSPEVGGVDETKTAPRTRCATRPGVSQESLRPE